MDTSVNEGGEQVSQGLNEDASQLTLTGAQKRAAWVLVGLMATVAYAGLWYFFFYDYWGERALRSLLEAIGIPLLIVLLWWPVVWASAKWLVRDLMRWVTSTRGGQRGRPSAPLAALAGFVASAAVLGAVICASTSIFGPAVADWRDGVTTHENVTCQNMREVEVARTGSSPASTDVTFDLVSPDGYARQFTINQVRFERGVDKSRQPDVTLMAACQSSDATLTIAVYERTGILAEARKDR